MPLVIVSNLRDQLACLLKINVLDNATMLAGLTDRLPDGAEHRATASDFRRPRNPI